MCGKGGTNRSNMPFLPSDAFTGSVLCAPPGEGLRVEGFRGTSLIRKRPPLGPYGRPMPRGL